MIRSLSTGMIELRPWVGMLVVEAWAEGCTNACLIEFTRQRIHEIVTAVVILPSMTTSMMALTTRAGTELLSVGNPQGVPGVTNNTFRRTEVKKWMMGMIATEESKQKEYYLSQ